MCPASESLLVNMMSDGRNYVKDESFQPNQLHTEEKLG